MQSGRLDRRIDIERRVSGQDAGGQPTDVWTKIATRRPAAYVPLSGDERFGGEQTIAKQQVQFLIRWSASVASVNPLDRIIYPATDDGSPEPVPQIYDILDVAEIGRREGLRITAARRAENA